MEEERLVSERSSGRNRQYGSYGSYGSCGRHPGVGGADTRLVKHRVQPGDTLQGLALKYQTTTEIIRRTNRLFASDSLFIKEYLLIPVSKDSNIPVEHTVPKVETLTHRASIAGIPNTSEECPFGSPDDKKTFNEFLSKVDSSLATLKKDVERTSEKSEFGRYTADIYTRKRPTSRLRQSASVGGVGTSIVAVLDNDNSYHGNMGETVVLAEGRHVRSSLQRLQRTQDEWFEL